MAAPGTFGFHQPHLNNSRVVSKKLTTMTPVKILGAQGLSGTGSAVVLSSEGSPADGSTEPTASQYAMLVRLESLILAQDERWRRA
jgi:hypothetical protein